MVLVKIALYIFIFTFVMYMAYRALWLIFFLFNFRFWEMLLLKLSPDFFASLQTSHKIILLTFLSIISYLLIYILTMKMPLIRYILLAVLFVIAIKQYSVSDILVFKDYFEKNGMWSMDYWYAEIKKPFNLKEGEIFKNINEVFNDFVGFFLKMIDAIKKM